MEENNALEIYQNNDEYVAKILEEFSRNGRNVFELLDPLEIQANDPLVKPQEFDSCSESLALLRSLGNFDPSNTSSEEGFLASNDTYEGILNSFNTTAEGQTTHTREFIDSSSTSVDSDFSQELSPVPSIHIEPAQELLIGPPSPVFSSSTGAASARLPSQTNQLSASYWGKCESRQKKNSRTERNKNHDSQQKSYKRKRARHKEDADELAREIHIWGPPDDEGEKTNDTLENDKDDKISYDSRYRSAPYSEDRLASINSAAVLFRRPSAASRKYTRAPISKIFVSLDLTVENFLKLQAAAKAYMLDEKFPERSDSVGSKRRADNRLKSLKLYTCVKYFLEEEGWGERCFGLRAEGGDDRKLRWPDSKNKIIQLMIPLMRRMVTNERQRRYALEARSEKRSKNSTKNVETPDQCELSARSNSSMDELGIEPYSSLIFAPQNSLRNSLPCLQTASTPNSDLDLNYSQDIVRYAAPAIINKSSENHRKICTAQTRYVSEHNHAPQYYYINFVWDSYCVRRRLILKPSDFPTFSRIFRHISEFVDHMSEKINSIMVHGPYGLVTIFNEETWAQAISLVAMHEWMDQDIRCLVKMETLVSQKTN